MKTALKFFAILLLITLMGCSKDDTSATLLPIEKETLKSSEKQITSFAFDAADNAALNETLAAAISENDKTIKATVAYGTDLTAFTPTIVASAKASVSPTGAQDFSAPVVYTITAEDETKTTYTATITAAPNSEKAIVSFQFLLSENPFEVNVIAEIDEENKLITFDVPDGADITALLPNIQISNNASISPEGLQNFEEPFAYTVTGEDGSTTTYEVSAVLSQRGILLAIYNTSPNNSLGWDIESADISDWQGVTTDADGNVNELYLGDGNIRNLSPRIGSLIHLTRLSINKSHYTELPKEIGNLINLTSLNLNMSKITRLPEEIGNLSNLTHLSIRESNLNELTAKIGNLSNLTQLSLSSNQLAILPSELFNLTSLTHLNLSSNQLTAIASEIGNLTNLTDLDLSSNQLTEIPAELGNLTNLTKLYLAYNQLTEIPSEIGNLINLTNLNLSTNQITEIPIEIGNLTNLVDLNLLQNPLVIIPIEVCNLESQHGTNVQMTNIKCISPSSKI